MWGYTALIGVHCSRLVIDVSIALVKKHLIVVEVLVSSVTVKYKIYFLLQLAMGCCCFVITNRNWCGLMGVSKHLLRSSIH